MSTSNKTSNNNPLKLLAVLRGTSKTKGVAKKSMQPAIRIQQKKKKKIESIDLAYEISLHQA